MPITVLRKIISGGQTGADQGGWEAAKMAGLETGGLMPYGFLTEEGYRTDFARLYGATEGPYSSSIAARYRRRAIENVRNSDATVCFDLTASKSTNNAYHDCQRFGKPFRCVMLDRTTSGDLTIARAAHTFQNIADWLDENLIETLNVAGNRESRAPGIARFVRRYLLEVFPLMEQRPCP